MFGGLASRHTNTHPQNIFKPHMLRLFCVSRKSKRRQALYLHDDKARGSVSKLTNQVKENHCQHDRGIT